MTSQEIINAIQSFYGDIRVWHDWYPPTQEIADWSRYPTSLARFMDCPACSGFWYGAILAILDARSPREIAIAAVAMIVLVPITLLTGMKSSLPWIAFMSVWANVMGHWSSWQGARAEEAAIG